MSLRLCWCTMILCETGKMCENAKSEFRSLDNTNIRVRDHRKGEVRAIEIYLFEFLALFSVC